MIKIFEKDSVNNFSSLSLEQIDKVQLLNRVDTKYVFNASILPELIKEMKGKYSILEIEGKRYFNYTTTYFDTPESDMFTNHVRGKLNRFKVRYRTYIDTGISFLEVKIKNNKNRTIKWRIRYSLLNTNDLSSNSPFLSKYIPYDPVCLTPYIQNYFTRLTFIDYNLNQRITFDLNLKFENRRNTLTELNSLIIAEVKSDVNHGQNGFCSLLRDYGVKQCGFSKYCIGRVLTEPDLEKSGLLKSKIVYLNKLSNGNIFTG